MNIFMQFCFWTIFVCFGLTVNSDAASQTIKKESSIHVYKAWARATPPNAKTAAVYMVIRNSGAESDLLVGIETPAAKKVEIHSVINENGMISMHRFENVSLPAQRSAEFKPGSIHMMLFGLLKPLKIGSHIDLGLSFKHAEKIQMRIPVKKRESDIIEQHNHNH